ncbi:MAG: hypothetical protein AAGG38_02910 [Planctomycetota bacterium]
MADEKFVCPHCQKAYRWQGSIAGKKVRCVCGQKFRVPMSAGGSAEPLGPPPPATGGPPVNPPPASFDAGRAPAAKPVPEIDPYDLDLPDLPPASDTGPAAGSLRRLGGSSAGKCPSCNTGLREGAVICLNCGFNLAEGKKIQTVLSGAAAGPIPDQPLPEKQGKLERAAARQDYDREVEADMARVFRRQEVIAPAVVAGLGLLILALNVLVIIPRVYAELGLLARFVPNASIQVEGLVASGVLLVLQVPCLLAGLFAVAALFGSSFGDLFSALRKLVALALFTGQVDTAVYQSFNLMLNGAGGIAWMVQASISFCLFWIISKLMFEELEVVETIGLWFAVGFIPSLLIAGYFLFL